MYNPFPVTSCLEELWIIKMPCVVIPEQNISLDYRMFGLPKNGKLDSLNFYTMCRGRLLFVSPVSSKEGQITQGFLLTSTYGHIQKLVINQ